MLKSKYIIFSTELKRYCRGERESDTQVSLLSAPRQVLVRTAVWNKCEPWWFWHFSFSVWNHFHLDLSRPRIWQRKWWNSAAANMRGRPGKKANCLSVRRLKIWLRFDNLPVLNNLPRNQTSIHALLAVANNQIQLMLFSAKKGPNHPGKRLDRGSGTG